MTTIDMQCPSPLCEAMFTSHSNLLYHLRNDHRDTDLKDLTCKIPECYKCCSTYKAFRTHLYRYHGGLDKKPRRYRTINPESYDLGEYLVKYENLNIVIEARNFGELMSKAIMKLKIENFSRIRLQLYNKNFEEWIDVMKGDSFPPTLSKLRLLSVFDEPFNPSLLHLDSSLLQTNNTSLPGSSTQHNSPSAHHNSCQLQMDAPPAHHNSTLLHLDQGASTQHNSFKNFSDHLESFGQSDVTESDASSIVDMDGDAKSMQLVEVSDGTVELLESIDKSEPLLPNDDLSSLEKSQKTDEPVEISGGSIKMLKCSKNSIGKSRKKVNSTLEIVKREQKRKQATSSQSNTDSSSDEWTFKTKGWPATYELPPFGQVITDHIEMVAKGTWPYVLSRIRNKIVNILFNAMTKYTLYPQPCQYRIVGHTLVEKFPVLRDRIATKGAYYNSWVLMLRNRYKDFRRRCPKNETRLLMQKKYSAKRKRPKDITALPLVLRPRRHFDSLAAEYPDLQDDLVTGQHIRVIQEEMQKINPSVEVVRNALNRTFEQRRKQLQHKDQLANVLKTYLPLKNSEWLLHEMRQLTGKDVLVELRLSKLSQLKLHLNPNKLPSEFVELIERDTTLTAWIIEIPLIFCENVKHFAAYKAQPDLAYPCIRIDADLSKCVCVDGNEVKVEGDFYAALATLVSSYWAFNIAFPPSLAKTMAFVCGFILRLGDVKIPESLLRIINKL